MKNRLAWLTVLAFFAFGAYRVWWSLQHPEVWDSDLGNDPRVYGPALALFGVLILLGFADLCWRQYRCDRRNRRFDALLAQAKEHVQQKRWAEADAALKSAERPLRDKT